ncbi:hypothetical protein [Aurantimonas sp. NFXS3]|uniref:hypothetical protein n=1 Tax=Aurantimonas sp. NFXS3 TaxID=2818434 RepID=UPI003B8BAA77
MSPEAEFTEPHSLSLYGSEQDIDRILNEALAILAGPLDPDCWFAPLQNQTTFDAWLISRTIQLQREEARAAEAAAALLEDEEPEGDDETDLAGNLENPAAGQSVNGAASDLLGIYRLVGKSVSGADAHSQEHGQLQPSTLQGLPGSSQYAENSSLADRSFSLSFHASAVGADVEDGTTPNLLQGRFKHAADEGKAKGLITRKGPPRWRDLGLASRVLALNDGLARRHVAHSAVTINLGRAIQARMRQNGAAWFGKRVSLALEQAERAIGRDLDFWLVLETWTHGAPRPHFHGVISCSAQERPIVEAALKQAAGKWDARRGEEYQIDWSERDGSPDDGWVDYVTKKADHTRHTFPDGSLVTASQQARQDARAAFTIWRAAQGGRHD